MTMAVNKPVGDNARKGAVRKSFGINRQGYVRNSTEEGVRREGGTNFVKESYETF
jgi:hypothetical protein